MILLLLALAGADFPISEAPRDQLLPVVTFANDQYYVFWADYRFELEDTTYAIFGARVTPSGTVLDPEGRQVFRWKAEYDVAVATDGIELMVALEDSC